MMELLADPLNVVEPAPVGALTPGVSRFNLKSLSDLLYILEAA